MTLTQLQERLNYTFYARDFKDGNNAKTWWINEFKNAKSINTLQELKVWALSTLEYTEDFSCYYIKEEVEQILNDIIYYAVEEVVTELNKEFGNIYFKKAYHLHDEYDANKFEITYKNTIVGSELVDYQFVKGYISQLMS